MLEMLVKFLAHFVHNRRRAIIDELVFSLQSNHWQSELNLSL